MFGPILENAATRYEGKLDVYKIDIDTSPEVPALFGIRSVPTTLFIAPGKEPALAMGALSGDAVEQAIKEQLGL